MTKDLRIKPLSSEEVSIIYERCLEYLSTRGIKVDYAPALDKLDKAGAAVDKESRLVRFPRDVIEAALKKAPRGFTLASRDGKRDMVIPHPTGSFYVRNGSGPIMYLDPKTNKYHDMRLTDVERVGQLLQLMDNIDICAFPSPTDAPRQTADIYGLRALIENTTKHINIQPYTAGSAKYLLELGEVAAGGKDALRRKPVVSITPNTTNPMGIKDADAEALIQACEHGIPVQVDSLPAAGGTSPATIMGTVLQICIELLGSVTVVQLLNPGNPVFAFPLPFMMDMASGQSLQSATESVLAEIAAVQVIKEAFQIPSNTYAFSTDSSIPDGQSMLEVAIKGAVVCLAGSDIISGAGAMEAYRGFSPIQLIVDNMLVSIFKRLRTGLIVDEDALAWEEIIGTAQLSGHYLDREHTLRHCRDFIRPELFAHVSIMSGLPGKDFYSRAMEKYLELEKKLKPLELAPELKRELDRIVKHADEHLVK